MTPPAAHALPTCPAEGHTSAQPGDRGCPQPWSIAPPWAPASGYPSHREALPGVDLKEGQSGGRPAFHPSRIQAESEGGSWELDAEGPLPPRESPTPPREASPFPGSPASIEQWTQEPFQLQGRTWPRSAGVGAPLGGSWACPPAAWAEPGGSLRTWAGPSVTGISAQRGVCADRGGPGLGLGSFVSPQLWAGERVVSRGLEAGSGSSPGWWGEVQGQQGGGSGWRSAAGLVA